MINYNAALPAMALSGRRGIDVNQWINDVKGNLTALARSMFAKGEQGIFLDPNDLTEEKIKWRRDLLTETEFRNGLNDATVKAGSLTPVAFAGLTAGTGIQVNAATGGTYIYKSATYKADTPYTFSCYVRMLDGTAPRFGSSGSGSEVDICLVLKNAAYQAEVQDLGGGLYRAYATASGTIVSGTVGVVKYQTNSSKPVIVSGYQLEEGSQLTEYQPFTDFNTEFLRQFPLHALYQDAAGTIPVTAQGQPVGLMLDKSKGLALGVELFNDSKAIIATAGSSRIEPNVYKITSSDGSAQSIEITGLPYGMLEVDLEILSVVSGSVRLDSLLNNTRIFSTIGKSKFRVLNTRGNIAFVRQATPTDVTLRINSIKQVLGNHAYQTVSASRPILQQTPILAANLLPTYDFRTWSATGTPSPVTANSFTTAATGGVQTPILKPNTKYIIELDFENTATINIYHGASVNTAFTAGARRKVLFEVTTDSGTAFYIRNAAAGTTTVHSISVREITGYRTDQNYLAFDGVDDFLQTNNIDFTATDKVSLFAGVRKLSDATLGYLLNLGDYGTQQGVFHIRAPQANAAPQVALYAKGTNGAPAIATSVPSGINFVLSGSAALATSEIKLKVNAILAASYNLSLGTGNFGNYPLYIGRFNGNASPFTGNLYSLIIVGRLTTDNETMALEKALAKNTGVTL